MLQRPAHRGLPACTTSTSCGVGCCQLPWGVHHDDIEAGRLYEWLPVVAAHICLDGGAEGGHLAPAQLIAETALMVVEH